MRRTTLTSIEQPAFVTDAHRSDSRGERPEIRAIVFDLGEVLIDVDYRYLYRKLLPTEEAVEEFLATVCTQAWHEQHDRGRPMAEGVAELIAEHPERTERTELIRAWDERFPEVWGGAIAASVEILTELRSTGVPLNLLSNWPADKFPVARERFSFITWFDGAVVSGEAGFMKPEPVIFHLLCGRFDLRPETTVFIDDSARRIEAARQLGLLALRFTKPAILCADAVGELLAKASRGTGPVVEDVRHLAQLHRHTKLSSRRRRRVSSSARQGVPGSMQGSRSWSHTAPAPRPKRSRWVRKVAPA